MLPIGEDNGIVEWVLNTTGLRHCLMDIYSAAGLYDSRTNRGIQKIWEGAPAVGGLGWVGWGGRAGGRHGLWLASWCAPSRRLLCASTHEKQALTNTTQTPTHPPSPIPRLQNKRKCEVLDEVLKGQPPLFHRWLLGKFTEPAAWLNARLAYTRTAGEPMPRMAGRG